MATVVKANKLAWIGGHVANLPSAETLVDVGFTIFARAVRRARRRPGVLSGPFIARCYARAFLEGRSPKTKLKLSAKRPTARPFVVSAFPADARLLQFATVSIGAGPAAVLYAARYISYLHNRGLADTSNRQSLEFFWATARSTNRNRSPGWRSRAREGSTI